MLYSLMASEFCVAVLLLSMSKMRSCYVEEVCTPLTEALNLDKIMQ